MITLRHKCSRCNVWWSEERNTLLWIPGNVSSNLKFICRGRVSTSNKYILKWLNGSKFYCFLVWSFIGMWITRLLSLCVNIPIFDKLNYKIPDTVHNKLWNQFVWYFYRFIYILYNLLLNEVNWQSKCFDQPFSYSSSKKYIFFNNCNTFIYLLVIPLSASEKMDESVLDEVRSSKHKVRWYFLFFFFFLFKLIRSV